MKNLTAKNNNDKYFDEWPETTPIEWWNVGRKQLNVVIRIVNEWTLDGCDANCVPRILRHIDKDLQTFAAKDGGSGWQEELITMQIHQKSVGGLDNSEFRVIINLPRP